MKIKAIHNLYCNGVDCAKGDLVEVSETMGNYLINRGWAQEVEKPKATKKTK